MTETHHISDSLLLEQELAACGIQRQDDGSFLIDSNGTNACFSDLSECFDVLRDELRKLKKELFGEWEKLVHIAQIILKNPKHNDTSCLDNLLFLNSVKKSHLLASVFDELEEVASIIERIFSLDISQIDENLVRDFNFVYTKVKILHVLVMSKIYRNKVIKQLLSLKKTAGMTGPWSNLDLPWQERVWNYDDKSEHEEYLTERTRAKQNQVRYNPEVNRFGFLLVWPEMNTRNPFLFGDEDEDFYPSRKQISIP